ncbi:E3 ubiquitin-protein ligase ZFP91-like isoform X2 [Platichthys flesus]|uniref:E3 ubiquitin-protein ligase ZFP91-like isoform X2 n=1 Tax=Platichthys flesus TaxID=8260 RepID=UPI002DBA3EF3|nr:E3 ubiquitin-protein ligase ZFP91-like isoform X2 [Platichthys flesus]
MDSGEDEVSAPRPGVEKTGDPEEAPSSSADSLESPSGRRGRRGRAAAAGTVPDPRSPAGGSVRVLRARGDAAGAAAGSEDRGDCTKKPASPLRGRGRRAGSRSRHSPVTQSATKKSTDRKASSLRPKPSKPGKGKGRTRASHTTAAAGKPEAGMETPSCGEDLEDSNVNLADADTAVGEDPLYSDDPDDLICQPDTKKKRSRQCAKLQQEEVKKEESEGEEEEEEENNVIKEETTEIVAQIEDGEVDNTEPTRKRGRQHKDSNAPRQPKRRKKPPVQYVRCEMEGCGTVLAHPRYLQHHIKYQHLLKKKYVCDHPSCGRLFRLQKQLLRHAKHHTDQRDYICEFCARAFKSSHNLAVHRMIHTGEKPIQCEICGFTCRQKASLNWHMKKHDAEASYQFSCSVCGKKFEKKDSVVAHKAKSHPEVLIAEAVAANGGTVIRCSTPGTENVPVLTQPKQPSVSQEIKELQQSQVIQESQEDAVGSNLTQLQQVVLPFTPQTQLDVSQGQLLQLPTHQVVQVAHQQQAPTLLHLTAAPLSHLSTNSHPQLIQLPALPASTTASMTTVGSQSTLLTLSSVTTLASQQAVQWGREAAEVAPLPGEGELWEKVIVGGDHQDVGDMIWESCRERRKDDEGVVWEREGERQILLQCAEIHGDNLI